ncbi:DUF1616 domain-containing protein [Natronoarchaeum sp. GCM10025703]|uniref:DUF1616 domain-containing protein n=1 Tax=Natronoarchaeum sp. GCM10025703 TaxID=3252685 RepID=UPI00361CE7B5
MIGLTFALNTAVFFPILRSTPLRVPLGFVFVCLVPGYVVVAALFPERFRAESGERVGGQLSSAPGTEGANGVTVTERFLLSVGLSIIIVPAIGYAWNFTPWGIQLVPVLLSVSGFTIVVAVLAALRRWQLPGNAQFRPGLPDGLDEVWPVGTGGGSVRVVNAVLVVSVLFFAMSAGYAAVELSYDEQYSEFYLLSGDGETFAGVDQSSVVVGGDQQTIGVAISNHEGQPKNYTVVVIQQTVDEAGNATEVRDQTPLDSFTVAVDADETVVRNYTFTPAARDDRSRVVWLLYPNDVPDTASTASAANHVYLWVVSNASKSDYRTAQ